jgi:hypothetical protein
LDNTYWLLAQAKWDAYKHYKKLNVRQIRQNRFEISSRNGLLQNIGKQTPQIMQLL